MRRNFKAKYFLMGEQKKNSRLAKKILMAAVLAAVYSGGMDLVPDSFIDNGLLGYSRACASNINITGQIDCHGKSGSKSNISVTHDAGVEGSVTGNVGGDQFVWYHYYGGWNGTWGKVWIRGGTVNIKASKYVMCLRNNNYSGGGWFTAYANFNTNGNAIWSGYENATLTLTGNRIYSGQDDSGGTKAGSQLNFGGKNVTLTGTSGTAFYYGNYNGNTLNIIAANGVINGDIRGQNTSRSVTINISGGTTTLKGGIYNINSTVNIANGSTLKLSDVNGGKSSSGFSYSNITFNNSGTLQTAGKAVGSKSFTNNGTGTVNMGSGNINVTGNFANSGKVNMSSGGISVSGTFTNNSSGTVNMSNGSISANSFTNNGTLNKSTGGFSVTNTFTNNSTGVLNMANNSADTITMGTFTSNSGILRADIDLNDGAVKGDKIEATSASGTIKLGNGNIFGSLDNVGDYREVQLVVGSSTNTVSFEGFATAYAYGLGSDHYKYSVENGTNYGYVKVTKLNDYYSLYSIINNKPNTGDADFDVSAITLYTLSDNLVLTADDSKELKYYETTTSSSQSTATGLGTLTGRTGGEFTLDGDSHTLDGGSQGGITVEANSGKLNLKNITLTNFSGDIVTNRGTVNIIGNVVMEGSIDGENGTLNIAAGNTLDMSSSSGSITGQTTFTNAGTLKMGNGTLDSILTNTGNLELNGTGLVAEINGAGKTVIKATSTVDNTTNNIMISQKDLTVENGAELKTLADKLVITNAVENKGKLIFTGGNIVSDFGATTTEGGMEIQGDVTNTDNKTIKLNTLTVSSGSLTTALENLNVSDANIINKGTLILSSATTANLSNNITDDSTATGILKITAGNITNTGKKTITQNSLEITGGSLTTEADTLTVGAITNNGTLILTADGANSDTLEETITGTGTLTIGTGNTVKATGTISQSTVNVTGADLDMDNTLTAATINIASGKKLFIDADNLQGDVANSGTVKLDGDGTLASGYTITGGNIDVSANVTANADDIKGTATVQSGYTLTLNGGTLTESITNNGTVDLTGGIGGLTGTVTGGTLNIKQNLQTNADNIKGNTNNVETSYTLTLDNGTLTKTITNSGTVDLTGITGLTAAVTGGTLNIKQNLQTNADNIKGDTNSVETGKTLTLDSGTLAKTVTGSGTLNVNGSVAAKPEYLSTGTNTVSASGNLTLADGTLNKEIFGNGTLNFNGNVSTNANYIKTETNTVASGKTLTLSSGSLTKSVANSGTVKFAGATEMQNAVTGGTLQFDSGNVTVGNAAHIAGDTNTINSGVAVTINSGTLTKNISNSGSVIMNAGSAIGVGGKIDGGDVTLNENVNFSAASIANTGTLTANDAIYNFNADMGAISVDKISVDTIATGSIKFGTVSITGRDDNWESGTYKQVQYITGGTGNDVTVDTTITVTSDGFAYKFEQGHEEVGVSTSNEKIGYLDIYKKDGYGLYQLVQNAYDSVLDFYAGTVNTYTLLGDYTETNDLGSLTRPDPGTARTFSIAGNNFKFLGNGCEGITVSSGDTLNLNEIKEISGWKDDTAVINEGTVNIDGTITLEDQLKGAGVYTNSGNLTVADAAKLQMTGTNGLQNIGIVNLGNATNSVLGADITGIGTTNINGDVSSGKNIENKVVIGTGKKLTNTGTISGAVENKGTFITTAAGITGGVKNTGSLELTGTGDLGCSITDDATPQGTTVVSGTITNNNDKTITQSNLTISNGGSLTTEANNLNISGTITDDGTLTLTGTGNLPSKVLGTGNINFGGNISANADYIAITGTATVATDKNLTLDSGSLTKAITNNGTVKFSGATAMQAMVSGGVLDFASGLVTVTDAAYIAGNANKVENGVTVKLISGTLDKIITGAGNIVVGNGTSTGTVTASIDKLANTGTLSVDNRATLLLTGNNTLTKDIGGTGTTKLDGTLTILADQTIAGTLDGNGNTLKTTSETANSTINTLTVGKLQGNLHLQLDVDMTAFTADKLAAGIVDSGANVTVDGINVTKDLTLTTLELPKTENNKIAYLTENGGTPTHGVYSISGGSITKTVTNGYEYTFTQGDKGKLNYTVAAINVTLKNFIEGTLPGYAETPATEIDPATLSLTDDMTYSDTVANAANDNQLNTTLNINLNGHNLTNSGGSVMTVSTGGKTLNIVGGATEESSSDLNFSVAENGTLAIGGKIKLSGTLSGAGSFSNEGTLTVENAAKLQTTNTNGFVNTGTLNLGNDTNSTLGADITGKGTVYIKGNVTVPGGDNKKFIWNSVIIDSGKKLTNNGIISGTVENAGTFITVANGVTAEWVKNTGILELTGTESFECSITDAETPEGSTIVEGNIEIVGEVTQKSLTIADGKTLEMGETLKVTEKITIGSGSTLIIGADNLNGDVVNNGTVKFDCNGTLESGSSISGGIIEFGSIITADEEGNYQDINISVNADDLKNANSIKVVSSNTANATNKLTLREGSLISAITNNGTTELSSGVSFGIGGKINGGNVILGENVNFTNENLASIAILTSNGAAYNLNANVGSSLSVDTISVTGKVTGTLKLGSVAVTGSDTSWYIGITKQVQYLNGGTDNDIVLTSTITVTSDGYKYTFGQGYNTAGDSSTGNKIGFMDIKKDNGYGLYQIIQNYKDTTVTPSFFAGTVNTYTLIEDYTETNDLGTLTRTEPGTSRTFTIAGNNHKFLGNGFEGIAVNDGDTLNLSDISEISGWKNGIAVNNSGTVNFSGTVILKDKLIGTGEYTNSGTLTVENAFSLAMTGTGGLMNIGVLNLGNATNSVLGADISGIGTTNINGDVSSSKNIGNKVVIGSAGKLTNTGTITGEVENAGTLVTVGNGFTNGVKNTGSLELTGTNVDLQSDITDDTTASGTTRIFGTLSNSNGKNITQKNLIIMNGGGLSTDGDRISVSENITNNGILELTGTNNISVKSINFADGSMLKVDGNSIKDTAAISVTDGATVESGAKLYISNVEEGIQYKILAGSNIAVDSWTTDDVVTGISTRFGLVVDTENTTETGTGLSEFHIQFKENPSIYNSSDISNIIRNLPNTENLKEWVDNVSMAQSESEIQNNTINTMANTGSLANVQGGAVAMSGFSLNSIADNIGIQSRPMLDVRGQGSGVRNVAAGAKDSAAIETVDKGKASEVMPTQYEEQKYNKEVWASFIHSKTKIEGMEAGHLEQDSTLQYNGTVVGVDLWSGKHGFGGVALTYGDGNFHSSQTVSNVKNDADYYGISIYNRQDIGKFSLQYDAGFTYAKNDVTMSTMGAEDVTSKPKVRAYSAGFKVEEPVKIGRMLEVVPFAGARYTFIKTEGYNNSLGLGYDVDNQHLVKIPVGMSLRTKCWENSGWKLGTILSGGYSWNLWNRSSRQKVSYGGYSDMIDFDIVDKGEYFVNAAVQAACENLMFELGYNYSKGTTTRNNRWHFNMNYAF